MLFEAAGKSKYLKHLTLSLYYDVNVIVVQLCSTYEFIPLLFVGGCYFEWLRAASEIHPQKRKFLEENIGAKQCLVMIGWLEERDIKGSQFYHIRCF